MTPELKTNLQNLPRNYSTWGALALAFLGYVTDTQVSSLEDLIQNFSPDKLATWLAGFIIFLGLRAAPQRKAPPDA
jgi:hypothetical protein